MGMDREWTDCFYPFGLRLVGVTATPTLLARLAAVLEGMMTL